MDQLSVSVVLKPLPEKITKRRLLSEVASIFDVVGVLSSVTVKSKLIMQQIWQEQIQWDEDIPPSLEEEFRAYYSDLTKLQSVYLNGHYSNFLTQSVFDLVGFCDTSDKAYCAVVYVCECLLMRKIGKSPLYALKLR